MIRDLGQILPAIDEFWENLGEIAHIHVEEMRGNIKGVFGGDLFPAHDENIVSKCGVYADTIILPDPFLRSRHVFEHFPEEEHAYYLMKHGLSILQYKRIACADIGTPIVAILPDRTVLEKEEKEFVLGLGEKTLSYTRKSSLEENSSQRKNCLSLPSLWILWRRP